MGYNARTNRKNKEASLVENDEIFTAVHAEECAYVLVSLQRSAKQSLTKNVVNKTLENFGKFVYSLRTLTSKADCRKTLKSDY